MNTDNTHCYEFCSEKKSPDSHYSGRKQLCVHGQKGIWRLMLLEACFQQVVTPATRGQ